MAVDTYLKIEPFHISSVLECSISQRLGEHGILTFRGVLDEEEGPSDMSSIKENTPIKAVTEKGTLLFQGLVAEIQFVTTNDGILAEMTALSHSCLLDQKRMSRSYQDVSKNYEDVIKIIKADNPNMQYNFSIHGDKPIQCFTLQYQETDWEFLRRMASRFHQPLAADPIQDKPAFFFGLPGGKALELDDTILELSYGVLGMPGIYRILNDNAENDLSNKLAQAQSFEFELEGQVTLGDKVTFQGKQYSVCQAVTWLKGQVLSHQVVGMEQEGVYLPTVYNPYISGLSLKGKVLKAEEDRLEIDLIGIDIEDEKDTNSKQGAHFQFSYLTMYATEGNAGWYFMPEKDDIVYLYFPSFEEGEAVIYGSVRMGGKSDDKIKDPSVKYIRTVDGQEIMLNKDEIRISTKEQDLFIRINEKEGIQISSNKAIRIESKKEILVNAASEIGITAKKELNFKGKSCEVKLGATMDIKGNVKVN